MPGENREAGVQVRIHGVSFVLISENKEKARVRIGN